MSDRSCSSHPKRSSNRPVGKEGSDHGAITIRQSGKGDIAYPAVTSNAGSAALGAGGDAVFAVA